MSSGLSMENLGEQVFKIARAGNVIGDFSKDDIQRKVLLSELLANDHVFIREKNDWSMLGQWSQVGDLFQKTSQPLSGGNDLRQTGRSTGLWRKFQTALRWAAVSLAAVIVITGALVWLGGDEKLDARIHTYSHDEEWNKRLNGSIRNLEVRVDRNTGEVTIEFDYDREREALYRGVPRPFLVRFFDAEGNYITHFTTSERYVEIDAEFPYEVSRLLKVGNKLQYKISIPDAAFAEIVEFGFSA